MPRLLFTHSFSSAFVSDACTQCLCAVLDQPSIRRRVISVNCLVVFISIRLVNIFTSERLCCICLPLRTLFPLSHLCKKKLSRATTQSVCHFSRRKIQPRWSVNSKSSQRALMTLKAQSFEDESSLPQLFLHSAPVGAEEVRRVKKAARGPLMAPKKANRLLKHPE